VQTTHLSDSGRNSLSTVGAAHHALRAYVFACNQRVDDGTVHRYQVLPGSAAIINQNEEVLHEAPLHVWAQSGRTIRSALVGLKYMADRLEHASALGGRFRPARLALDALADTASINFAGMQLTRDELRSRAHELWLSEGAIRLLDQLTNEEFATVEGWARLGRQLELDFFFALQGAETYGLEAAALAERERGYRIGTICRPRRLTASNTAA
jgi:hypothetical protein